MSEYDEIIQLPHFHAPGKPCMSRRDRAGQFAPFKSLDDYHSAKRNEKQCEIFGKILIICTKNSFLFLEHEFLSVAVKRLNVVLEKIIVPNVGNRESKNDSDKRVEEG